MHGFPEIEAVFSGLLAFCDACVGHDFLPNADEASKGNEKSTSMDARLSAHVANSKSPKTLHLFFQQKLQERLTNNQSVMR